MQAREAGDRRAQAKFYAEFGAGKDTNVNGGTFRDTVQLAFGLFQPLAGSDSQRRPDNFVQGVVGGQTQMQVSPRLAVFAGWDLNHRVNRDERDFDITSASVFAGFTQLGGGALWRFTLGGNDLQLGHNRYRDTLQLNLDATYSLGQNNTFVPFAQVGELRHAKADEDRNSRLSTLGGQFTANFPQWPGEPALGLRVSTSVESNLRSRRDFSREQTLVRVFGSFSPLQPLRLALGLSGDRQRYGADDPVFGTLRKDDTVTIDGSATWNFDARWSLRAEGYWTRVRSNQDLYDSDRKVASLRLRYQY
jgi:hypothetical protein